MLLDELLDLLLELLKDVPGLVPKEADLLLQILDLLF